MNRTDLHERQDRSKTAIAILVLVTAACLGPFLGKAFHIDDPLFLWTAKQIQAKPFDFYGFTVNWSGYKLPMTVATANPPLAAYYIAAAAYVVGWSEAALHMAFFLPALAAALGTFFLARELCSKPLFAALVAVLSPVFLLCSTSVMCDTMMLGFWVWAVFFWVRGLRRGSAKDLTFAVVLISLCALTKYFGVSLVPLLAAYSLASRRRLGRWIWLLAIPLLVLGAYQWVTYKLYGQGHLTFAAGVAVDFRAEHRFDVVSRLMLSLAFAGGCLVVVLFYTPWLWKPRWILLGMGVVILLLVLVVAWGQIGAFRLGAENRFRWDVVVQMAVFSFGGLSLLALGANKAWRVRNPETLLLALWCFGTFIFAWVLNWTVSGRNMLPMIPAVGVLLVRRMDARGGWLVARNVWSFWLPLVPAAMIALLVTWADFCLANASRAAAAVICQQFARKERPLWFQGHWGFQYYMEQEGAKDIELEEATFSPGDQMVSPLFGSYLAYLNQVAKELMVCACPSCRLVTPLNMEAGAGYYSSQFGPLPYALIWQQVDKFSIYEVTNSLHFSKGMAYPGPPQ
jgi:4-amino-4-deoxy-L-arabinose transferase-like glycosyltransferase